MAAPPVPELEDPASLGMPGEPEMNSPVSEPVETDPLAASPGATADSPEIPEAPEINWELAGECLACITGLFQEKPITPEQGRRAEGVLFDLQRQIVKFCKFGKFDEFKAPKLVDFEDTYANLIPMTEDEARVCTQDLSSVDLIDAWETVVNRGRDYVRSVWPIAIRETPTGPEWNDPSRSEGGKALAMLMVASDCRELLAEMNRQALGPSQVEAVKTIYPLLFARIGNMFQLALAEAGQRNRKCPWDHELLIRELAGIPTNGLMTFGTEETPESKPVFGEVRIKFDNLLTKSQKLP